jgi:hypothetical protein
MCFRNEITKLERGRRMQGCAAAQLQPENNMTELWKSNKRKQEFG